MLQHPPHPRYAQFYLHDWSRHLRQRRYLAREQTILEHAQRRTDGQNDSLVGE